MPKDALFARVEDERRRLETLAEDIWKRPELGLHETHAADALAETLADAGFDVERGVGGMPTAFVAEYGPKAGESGPDAPVVGILGEYDALPGLSQAVKAERDPIEEGGPGHGCGHNLFGTAGVGAALALADAVDDGEVAGTVRFYGCPAEEILVGKTFMARAGAFDDLDAALTWHPGDLSTPKFGSSLALDSVQFTFHGESAHAAGSPESGRSALDAVQLLNTGVEYVREHVSDEARIHYSVPDGGDAPNVVPAEATGWYYVRAPRREEVERISDWLTDVAEGAALMTRTEVERRYVTGCYDYLTNEALTEVVWENMQAVDPPAYDESDRAFAAELRETFDEASVRDKFDDLPEDAREEVLDAAIHADPVAPYDHDIVRSGSTEVGDVSWIAPTAQFRGATWAVGTPAHTWQAVAANGSFGPEGMLYAAKVLAGAAYDVLADDDLVAAARAEFDRATDGREYETPLPKDAEPPFDLTAD